MMYVIRPFQSSDAKSIATLFYETVHTVNAQDYTSIQLNAWAPKLTGEEQTTQIERFHKSLSANLSYVATISETLVGFADITTGGYLDHMYVHKDYQRQGIASDLLRHIEQNAIQLSVKQIRTDASRTAKGFFEQHGYETIEPQTVHARGVAMVNFKMIKQGPWTHYL